MAGAIQNSALNLTRGKSATGQDAMTQGGYVWDATTGRYTASRQTAALNTEEAAQRARQQQIDDSLRAQESTRYNQQNKQQQTQQGVTNAFAQGTYDRAGNQQAFENSQTQAATQQGLKQQEYLNSQSNRSLTDAEAQQRWNNQQAQVRANQRAELLVRLEGMIGGMNSSSSSSDSSATTPWVPAPYTPDAEVAYEGQTDPAAALAAAKESQAANFGQAKAQAGALGRSSIQSLRNNLAERGILGSGTEARGLVTALGNATNPLADVTAAGLKENVGITQHAGDMAQHAADTKYQGSIAQRGQNQSARAANQSLQLGARGQDISARESRRAAQQSQQDTLMRVLAGLAG